MASWDHFGDIANVAQLTGLDAVRLIGLIVKAASTARMHKQNCRQFAQHLKLIGNLLEQLKITELKKHPATREPLEQLEDALRRSYILVNSCQDRSYLYLLAMGWNIVYQFRKAQTEIDRYLRLVPLITLVDNARVREKLEVIEYDQREYTLDDVDRKVQDVIMKPERSPKDATVLKKSLSCSYPDLPFKEALRTESQKLRLELQISQANLDVGQCEVIQHLIEVAEVAALTTEPEKNSSKSDFHQMDHAYTETKSFSENVCTGKRSKKSKAQKISMNAYTVTPDHNQLSITAFHQSEEWHSDLLGCCAEPYLCFSTLFWPCGTFSKIATVATHRHMSSVEACNELLAYSLILSCCCYTCGIRGKLRKSLNIEGGSFDDFLSHLMCCCCALVQEWREVQIRGIEGMPQTPRKMAPPPSQHMES